MVSEKSAAFGAAGASLSHDWLTMQRDWNAQLTDVAAMMLARCQARIKRRRWSCGVSGWGAAALASSVRAMAPIHRVATANERRLARKR